ncbi:MAG TPA: hypothetical protein VN577_00965 [Terriglobales bacterium]|nr:hypothetical protein [Terriglobales bacterium]
MKAMIFLLLLCVMAPSHAQENPLPDAPTPQVEAKQKRRFSFIPVASSSSDAPLSTSQKFLLFADNSTNPFQIVAAGAKAGVSQARDKFPAYGQGAEGYGKRFGAALADQTSMEFFGTFVFPSVLRTDPRYFRKETGSASSRTLYSITRVFVTRNDHRRPVPNAALWMGAIAAGGLSNAYYPDEQRGVGLVFSRAGIVIGTRAGFNVVKEFWPDIWRTLKKR